MERWNDQQNDASSSELDTLLCLLQDEKSDIYDITPDAALTTFPCYGSRGLSGVQPINNGQRQDLDALYAKAQSQLEHISTSGTLPAEDGWKRVQLAQALDSRRTLLRITDHRWPVDSSSRTTITSFLRDAQGKGHHSFDEPGDFDAFVGQASGFGTWVTDAIESMEQGVIEGDTLSQYTIERVLGTLAVYIDNDGQFVRDAVRKPLETGCLPARNKQLYSDAVEASLLPGIQKLYEYIRDVYAGACRPDQALGLCNIPDGREQYERLLQYHLGDNVSVEDVYEFADDSYHRLYKELDIMAAANGTASREVFEEVYTHTISPEHAFATIAEIVEACEHLQDTLRLENVFLPENIPDKTCELNVITDHTAATSAGMYGNNIFSLPVSDPKQYTTATLQDLYLHEAVGHHVGLTNHLATMPPFLKDVRNVAVGEGWAMYVEGLGAELAAPVLDTYARMLTYPGLIGTAVFMMLDIQINRNGWPLDKARQFLEEKLSGSDFEKKGNMARLLAWPAQGHAYLYGRHKFQVLQKEARQRLGARFDLRKFHGSILAPGEAPFNQLAARIQTAT